MKYTSQNSRDSPDIELRPYQQEALETMCNYEGHSALLVIATGLGKTIIFDEFIRKRVLEDDHNCLILSHREELVTQPLKYLPDIPCGIELGKKHSDFSCNKVISASVQSLEGRLNRYNPREVDTIIVDEAHHAVAPTYRKILSYFETAQVFGFTATSQRGDKIGLGNVFEDLVFERNLLWGIENHYLCPIECQQVRLKYSMESVRITEYGELNASDVARIMSGTAAGVAEVFQKYARGPTIIYAASVREAKDITEIINKKAGKTLAVTILNSTPDRGRWLSAFEDGFIQVLVNFGVLTEGTDLPCTETIIMARPIARTNVGLYAQCVGRGLRMHPGKKSCLVVDMVGISSVPICTAATLIGKDLPKLDPNTEKKKPEGMVPAMQPTILSGKQIPETWIDQRTERRIDIMENGIGTDMHNVAWIPNKNGGFLLAIPNVVYRISRPLSDGTAYLRRNKKCAKNPMPLQFLFDYVYTDLEKKHKNNRHIWDKEQRSYWGKGKASESQITLIHQLSPDYKIDPSTLTSGDASILIQELLYSKEVS